MRGGNECAGKIGASGRRPGRGALRLAVAVVLLGSGGAVFGGAPRAETEAGVANAGFSWDTPQLYVVATSHLDTQWRWTIRETIEEYLPATLRDNFALFEKYPGYVFNFEGAFRYMLMREYYPVEYARLRDYVAQGRWRVAGSWVDAVDTNMPSPESLIRHVLYGNGFFHREFGVTSRDVLLPDCFGFGYALPTIAAHCGLLGFSTQKLTWGSAVGVPFDIGLWEGVDGSRLVAALNPGEYVARLASDQASDSVWAARAAQQGAASGLHAAYRYFGTGDTGGAPTDESVAWLERGLAAKGPLQVRSVAADQLARDLVVPLATVSTESGHGSTALEAPGRIFLARGLRPELFADDAGEALLLPATAVAGVARLKRLPHYRGELLMTDHGAGCYTSQAAMKRWNRQNECLADAAERAAIAAHWLGGAIYPREALRQAWIRFLWHQFHDDLTGTSVPEAYVYSWNDEALSLNQFATVLSDAVGAVSRVLKTDVLGTPLVVYNPLSVPREDVVVATVSFPDGAPEAVRIYDRHAREVPSQILGGGETSVRVAFVAAVPSIGFAVYDVVADASPCMLATGLRAWQQGLENERYRVTLDEDGDIASIRDKRADREMLGGALELQLLDDAPWDWPAWEVDFDDLMAVPRGRFGAPARVAVVENGPARVTLEITRALAGSTVTQRVSLAAGGAGDHVAIDLDIDWRTKGAMLKAAFPLAVAPEEATYDLGTGVITRGVNRPELYEVPAQRWADLSAEAGDYGVAIVNDSRHGWDRPNRSTLRLTLVRTPEVNDRWQWVADQSSQDLGRHRLGYAICGHRGDWRDGDVAWVADRFNQPLRAFATEKHAGHLGREFSLLSVEPFGDAKEQSKPTRALLPAVAVQALKLAEGSDEVILRLQERSGAGGSTVRVRMVPRITQLSEVNGAEEPVRQGQARPVEVGAALDSGALRVALDPFQPRTFAIRLGEPVAQLFAPSSRGLDLPYDLDGISTAGDPTDGDFDGQGRTLVGELLPRSLVCASVILHTGPQERGAANVLSCRGQRLEVPPGDYDQLYLLLAAVGGDRAAEFVIESDPGASRGRAPHPGGAAAGGAGGAHEERVRVWVPDYAEPIAQWDSRVLGRELLTDAAQILPGYVKTAPVAWVGTHRRDAAGEDEAYQFTYLFLQRIALPWGARALRLPEDPQVRVLAVTAARNENAATQPAEPFGDVPEVSSVRIEAPRRAFVDAIDVRLSSPNPGAVIRCTFDGSEPTEEAAIYQGPFSITATTTVRARAFVEGMDDRFAAAATFTKLVPREPHAAGGLQSGLACRYYEGAWERLPDFSALAPLRSVIAGQLEVPEFARAEDIGVEFSGYLSVPADGVYTFHLWSDDGSAMDLGGERLIDNDGLHGSREQWADVALRAGAHPVAITYFQHLGGAALELWVEGPGIDLRRVPQEWWGHVAGGR